MKTNEKERRDYEKLFSEHYTLSNYIFFSDKSSDAVSIYPNLGEAE